MPIHESIALFGPEERLIGVLTQPAAAADFSLDDSKSDSLLGCLLLNTGINHRIGPRRINVKTARALAAIGIPSLRFDLSGIGDSRASTAPRDFRQQTLLDMRAALDHLQARTGSGRFVVFGICSGAINALALALADHRVAGVTLFDGHAFLSKGVRIARKLRRWRAFPFNAAVRHGYPGWHDWAAWAAAPLDAAARRRALQHLARRRPVPQSTPATALFQSDAPPYCAQDFTRDMMALVERQVDVYLMYSNTLTAVDRGRDLLRGLHDAPFLGQVRYRFWPGIDHTVTTLAAQHELIATVCGWAQAIAQRSPAQAAIPVRPQAMQDA